MIQNRCPECYSLKTVWQGYYRTRKARLHMRKCQNCGRCYTPKDQNTDSKVEENQQVEQGV